MYAIHFWSLSLLHHEEETSLETFLIERQQDKWSRRNRTPNKNSEERAGDVIKGAETEKKRREGERERKIRAKNDGPDISSFSERNEILFLVPEGMSFAWLTSGENQGKRCTQNPLPFDQRATQKCCCLSSYIKVYQRSQSKWLKRRELRHWNCYFISIFLLPKQARFESPQRQRFYPFSSSSPSFSWRPEFSVVLESMFAFFLSYLLYI